MNEKILGMLDRLSSKIEKIEVDITKPYNKESEKDQSSSSSMNLDLPWKYFLNFIKSNFNQVQTN